MRHISASTELERYHSSSVALCLHSTDISFVVNLFNLFFASSLSSCPPILLQVGAGSNLPCPCIILLGKGLSVYPSHTRLRVDSDRSKLVTDLDTGKWAEVRWQISKGFATVEETQDWRERGSLSVPTVLTLWCLELQQLFMAMGAPKQGRQMRRNVVTELST